MDTRQDIPDDDISLKELILKVQSAIRELIRRWPVVALFVMAGLGVQILRYISTDTVYPATLTFSVDEDETGGMSGITGILGQFGLGSMRPARYNLDKVLALSKSRNVVTSVLFSKDSDDFLANHLIREYQLTLPPLPGEKDRREMLFTHDSLPLFTRDENSMLMTLYYQLIGLPNKPKKALMKANYDEDTNIMELSVTTTNENLSAALVRELFQSLSQYYINKAVEKQLQTYQVVVAKRDSILGELKSAEYALAQFKDSHHGLLMRTDQLTEMRLQREIAALGAMYGEAVKNTEIAGFSLKNKTPFIRVIDSPLSPLAAVRPSLPRSLLIGILLGGLVGSIFVVGRMVWRNIMTSL
jgi:uncharacterized protein involved in exopolysaccharide biosynthesis